MASGEARGPRAALILGSSAARGGCGPPALGARNRRALRGAIAGALALPLPPLPPLASATAPGPTTSAHACSAAPGCSAEGESSVPGGRGGRI